MAYFQHFRELSKNVWAILMVFLLYAFSWPVIAFLPLYLQDNLHYSLLQTGVSVSVYGVGFVIASFFGASLCDRFSAYHVTLTSTLCFLLSLLLIARIHGPYAVVLGLLILLGMSNAVFAPAARMLLMRSVPESDQMRANGLRYMLFNLGTAAAFGTVGLLIQNHYSRVFIFSAVFAVLMTLCLILFCKPDTRPLQTRSVEITKRWPNRSYLLILGCFFLGMLVFAQTNSTYSLFLTHYYELSTAQLSFLFLLNSLLVALFQMTIIARSKQLPQTLVMNVGSVIMGFGFMILIFGTSYWLAIVSLVILTLGEMLFMPVSQTLAYQAAPDNAKGYYMGIYQAVFASTFVFAPLLGTIALHVSDKLLWPVCLLLCLIPTVFSLLSSNSKLRIFR